MWDPTSPSPVPIGNRPASEYAQSLRKPEEFNHVCAERGVRLDLYPRRVVPFARAVICIRVLANHAIMLLNEVGPKESKLVSKPPGEAAMTAPILHRHQAHTRAVSHS